MGVCVKDASTISAALMADRFVQMHAAHCASTGTGYQEAPPLAEELLALDGCWREGGNLFSSAMAPQVSCPCQRIALYYCSYQQHQKDSVIFKTHI